MATDAHKEILAMIIMAGDEATDRMVQETGDNRNALLWLFMMGYVEYAGGPIIEPDASPWARYRGHVVRTQPLRVTPKGMEYFNG